MFRVHFSLPAFRSIDFPQYVKVLTHSQQTILRVKYSNTSTVQIFATMRTNFYLFIYKLGHAVARFVEALRYKPEGRMFDFRWYHWNFSLA